MQSSPRHILLLTAALAIAACGGGGGGATTAGGAGGTGSVPGAPSENRVPTANAGPDQDVDETSTVNLDGSASSDLDGDALSFSWRQTAGTAVTLSDAAVSTPSFTAPDVAAGNPETLTFELTVSDGTATDSDTVSVTVTEPPQKVSVAGRVYYEFVPPVVSGTRCTGLNFSATEERPIRRATVQLLDADNTVIGTTTAAEDGSYAFPDIDAGIDVRVRVRAELKKSGAPSWDVEVRDNVDTSESPAPLKERPLYVVQWELFNTGARDLDDADFTARAGWTGST